MFQIQKQRGDQFDSSDSLCEQSVQLRAQLFSTYVLMLSYLIYNRIVMILHYNTTLTPSSKAIYSGTKYYDTHIEFHSLFLDVSSTDV